MISHIQTVISYILALISFFFLSAFHKLESSLSSAFSEWPVRNLFSVLVIDAGGACPL